MPDMGISLVEWGAFQQAVKGIVEGFEEMRFEFRELRKLVGTRCSDCAVSAAVKDDKERIGKLEERLRYLEIKVAGIAVISGIASAFVTKVLIP